MKVFLLHRDSDFAIEPELQDEIFAAMVSSSANPFAIEHVKRNRERARAKQPSPKPERATPLELLAQDLELETVCQAMAAGNEYLFETARRALLSSLRDPDAIVYRQQVLADCLEHPAVVRALYRLSLEGLEVERKAGSLWSRATPRMILRRSAQALRLQLDVLRRLRRVADEQRGVFRSDGFTRFFAMLEAELSDEYLATVEAHLEELEFKRGLLETALLGKGLKGRDYVVRRERERSLGERLVRGRRTSGYSFQIHPRDESGARALEELRGRGLNEVANAVGQSADHVMAFFTELKLELAFYLGCLNLHEELVARGKPVCVPQPLPPEETSFVAEDLYDVALTLHLDEETVGNDVDAGGKSLMFLTGANQGGKSTLLRALGVAQLMLQAGMFVGARSFRANVCAGVFTHYKREEDDAMESGKLDEELRRMSELTRGLAPTSLLLCNESFASTNEREGSEIARQIVRALLERRIKVLFVTHMYDLAHGFHAEGRNDALFLLAERLPDGSRTFKLREGDPLPTSYGEDSYVRLITGGASEAVARPG
jgi:DNA mismatch repair ATPase MutS